MRGLIVFLGLLLMLGGGAVAGVQYAPVDLSSFPQLDQLPGSREFLKSQMALYAGGGAAGFGFLLIIIALATGGKKKREKAVVKSPSLARETIRPQPAPAPKPAAPPAPPVAPVPPQPVMAAPKPPPPIAPPPAPPPAPQPTVAAAPTPQAAPAPQPVTAPPPPKPAAPMPPLQPVAAAPVAAPSAPPPVAAPPAAPPPVAAPPPAAPTAKPQASAHPPASAQPASPPPATGAPPPDPRVVNRKRIQDLVTLNDALKAFHARNGAFPKAEGLAGANERGAGWIPGLSPDFLPELPRDPLQGAGTQYVYVSDGANYKLLAQGVSLVGGINVEVLGIKIDPTRNPTPQNAAFGFWTPGFAGA